MDSSIFGIQTRKFLPGIIPCLFTIISLLIHPHIKKLPSGDGYFLLNSIRGILEGYGYSGYPASSWPPMYPLVSSFFGWIFGLPFGAYFVSVISAAGILLLPPLITNLLMKDYIPGIAMQIVLLGNPTFMENSLFPETHMLDAFLFLLAVYCAIDHFQSDCTNLPLKFLIISALACLTRHTSWALIFTFLLFSMPMLTPKKNWRFFSKSFLIPFFIYIPWPIYNSIHNGLSLTQGQFSRLIGVSFMENNLMNYPHVYWLFVEAFHYKDYFGLEIIMEHPLTYVINIGINSLKFLRIFFFEFPILGGVSWIVGIGFIGVLINSWKKKYRFILVLLGLFMLGIVTTRFAWNYFINLAVLYGTLGFGFIFKKGNQILNLFKTKRLNGLLSLAMIIVGIGTIQAENIFADFNNLINKDQRQPEDVYVISQLEKLRKSIKVPADSVHIMSSFYYLRSVSHAGFKAVLAPIPDTSPHQVLCYSNLDQDKLKFIKLFNYPPSLKNSRYVPPDYLMIGGVLGPLILREPGINLIEFKPYLERLDWWNMKHQIELYEVNKKKLPCG